MSTTFSLTILYVFISIIFLPPTYSKSTYIIHISKPHIPTTFTSHQHFYTSILDTLSTATATTATTTKPHLLYTYTHSSTGFAAHLTPQQVAQLSHHPAVLGIVQDKAHEVFTTRTPEYLGLTEKSGIWPKAKYGSDIVIGVLDSGIWGDIPSFLDDGYGPVPDTWKGSCEVGPEFPEWYCNRKIIGARAFYKGYEAAKGPMNETKESKSPLDTTGHGTHTASTAAGSVVLNAGSFNYAQGEARGTAFKARIAAYKVCWIKGCFESDILAAMDQAIDDGVHVISLSVGPRKMDSSYDKEGIVVGALHAAQRGVVVSCAVGNFGPKPFTAVNVAPWILSVGASTIDREFPADVVLGDGRSFKGASLYAGDALNGYVSLVNGADCGSKFCLAGELNSSKVEGKMVICDRGGGNARVAKGDAVKQAGGVGMILANSHELGDELLADLHLLPATLVTQTSADQIIAYVSSSPNATATIKFKGTVTKPTPSSPRLAAFSSRGPNRITPEILKPDVIAPGVNILAGWTGAIGPSGLEFDSRRSQFSIQSGTSMACPHVSGLAALLRNTYPNWSPAAIKSALMTTAYNLDNSGRNFSDLATGNESSPFVHGSGHVDPNKALDPGLVYDIDTSDYIAFLCTIGYDSKQIAIFLKDPVPIDCAAKNFSSPGNLNYPSFSVVFESGKSMVKYTRVVKNVGSSVNAVYRVNVNAPQGVDVSVYPRTLKFSAKKQTLSYEIAFTSFKTDPIEQSKLGSSSFGSIEWSDGNHRVRSPIAVRWIQGTQQHYVASI